MKPAIFLPSCSKSVLGNIVMEWVMILGLTKAADGPTTDTGKRIDSATIKEIN